MGRVLQARMVNSALGGLAVGPGDIDGLQEELLLACHAVVFTYPEKMRIKNAR